MIYQPIRIVRPGEFSSTTAQTPGSQRLSAISATDDIASPMWRGIFVVEPGARTGIHHHGEQYTIVYVLEGSSHIRWGERGDFHGTVQAGDFVHLPAWLPHQEINASLDAPFKWVVVRSTADPIVVNLPDDFWPAS